MHKYTGKRRVKILTGWEGNDTDGIIIVTNATPKAIKQWIESDKSLDYKNLKSEGWYVRCLYDPQTDAFGDCTAIGCDEAYRKDGTRADGRNEVMAEKRKVLILTESETRKESGIVILTNAPTDKISEWVTSDTGLNPENLEHAGFYAVLLYQPDENPPDDLEAIGFDEVYNMFGDRRDDIAKREQMHKNLVDIVDTAVRAHGYKILDGDRDTVIIRFDGNGPDFQIKVSDT